MKMLTMAAWGLAILLGNTVRAQTTVRMSVDSGGVEGGRYSTLPSISGDGRYVAFTSLAGNLVAGDTNAALDVFVRDRQTGTTERISVSTSGADANGESWNPVLSADGRYVAFSSDASNLVSGDTNGHSDVFIRDRQLGTTSRVSVDSNGAQGDHDSDDPSISADGRFVAFDSSSSNLVSGDTNSTEDVFVHDLLNGVTTRMSVSSAGVEGDDVSFTPSLSADGRFVAFSGYADNLVAGDANQAMDVFVHDRLGGTTLRASVDSNGIEGRYGSGQGVLSMDGRLVAFHSQSDNLVPLDTNVTDDVFVHDLQTGVTWRVSVDSNGAQADNVSSNPSISADGRYVAFGSFATNFVSGDTNGTSDIFVHDLLTGATEQASVNTGGTEGNHGSFSPSLSADGRYVAFSSQASNLVAGDGNGCEDVFAHDRGAVSPMTSLCDPGVGGVIACPCSNPPSSLDRGCNNSANTGGASLSAAGLAHLSADSLVFTTSGEKPTATSTLWQGPSTPVAGIVFGQGVRCVNGALNRLFNKSAIGGSIVAPDFSAGDPTISARSAARGAPIVPGQTRYYFVSYRDPIVLGGCLPSSTFNATQTGEVSWAQ